MNLTNIITGLLTENILILGILLMMFFEMTYKKNERVSLLITFLTLGGILLSLLFPSQDLSFENFYVSNFMTSALKGVLLILALPVIAGLRSSFWTYKAQALFLSSLLGAFLMISSTSFLTLFIGLELLALPTYVLVFLGTQRTHSAEAALKYLVLGSASSAIILLASVFLYLSTGSLALDKLSALSEMNGMYIDLFFMLFFVSFFFKTALVPFHQWAPDAYDGADLGITSYMATFVKGAYLLALGRLFVEVETTKLMLALCGILPLASILWGNLAAIKQKSFSRLMAYSSIAHAAYIYFAFIGVKADRLPSITFYILSYGLVVAATFITLNYLSEELYDLKNFQGLAKRHPWAAGILSFGLLSLAGIPPLPGFFAKFFIFKNVLASGYTIYALAAFLSSYIGIYFYLRLIVLMYMGEKEEVFKVHRPRLSIGLALGSLALLIPSVWLTNLLMN